MTKNKFLFDKKKIRSNHIKASKSNSKKTKLFLKLVSDKITEKILDISNYYETVLEIGSRGNHLEESMKKHKLFGSIYKTVTDHNVLYKNANSIISDIDDIPFINSSFNLCTSLLSLNNTENILNTFIQIKNSLKSNGAFIFAITGGSTLHKLREIFIKTELERSGKVFPRFIPMTNAERLGTALLKAGFIDPVIDKDFIYIKHKNTKDLMKDIIACGESNSLFSRSTAFTPRQIIMKVFKNYQTTNQVNINEIETRIEVFYITAFK